jgi:hypothetical protein
MGGTNHDKREYCKCKGQALFLSHGPTTRTTTKFCQLIGHGLANIGGGIAMINQEVDPLPNHPIMNPQQVLQRFEELQVQINQINVTLGQVNERLHNM